MSRRSTRGTGWRGGDGELAFLGKTGVAVSGEFLMGSHETAEDLDKAFPAYNFKSKAAGDIIFHTPNEIHATKTADRPMLAVWSWTKDTDVPARLVES